jgi:hypothetical protein
LWVFVVFLNPRNTGNFVDYVIAIYFQILSNLSFILAIFAQSKNCGAKETAFASERLWNKIRF